MDRFAEGMLIAALNDVGGGRYVPKRRRRARIWEVSRIPAIGVALSCGKSGLAAKI